MIIFWDKFLTFQLSEHLLQGEVGPPGQAGFEGGPGSQGNVGPRGMALHGKAVSKSVLFTDFPTRHSSRTLALALDSFLLKSVYVKGPSGARGEKGDPGRPGERVR